MKSLAKETAEVTGKFWRQIFRSEDSGYGVCVYRMENGDYVTVTGENLPEVKYPVTFSGSWVNDPRYGKQFRADAVVSKLPNSTADIISFIATLRTGIGEKKAQAMLKAVSPDAFWETLENSPETFYNVKGCTPRMVDNLRKRLGEQRCRMNLLKLFNGELPLDGWQYKRICNKWREELANIPEMVKANPFILLDVGYGFRELDRYAYNHSGFAVNDNRRLAAAAAQALLDAQEQGHAGLPEQILLEKMRALLTPCGAVPAAAMKDFLDIATTGNDLVFSNDLFYLSRSYTEEVKIAEGFAKMVSSDPLGLDETFFEEMLTEYQDGKQFVLSQDQREAVWTALNRRICIITGGPGTGKSTILDAILFCWQKYHPGSCISMMAPTGKASVRMAETTGNFASTIHSRLQLFSSDDPKEPLTTTELLTEDLIVIDETSMVDQSVTAAICSALQNKSQHLVLVGDPDQLASVGYGNILADLIESDVIPVCSLNTIYRQAAGNPIITNATKMRNGDTQMDWTNSAFRRYHHGTDEENMDVACRFYLRCVKQFGIENVVILSPYRRKTSICTNDLNKRLQEAINPDKGQPSVKGGGNTFRVGDRVMQLKNTPGGLSNGDVGVVTEVNPSPMDGEYSLKAQFECGVTQEYYKDDLIQLDLAYAMSVHKSQGSQYTCVILLLPCEPTPFLRRNLVYTAITRAIQYVAVIGPIQTLSYAIENNRNDKRYTNLVSRLRASVATLQGELRRPA